MKILNIISAIALSGLLFTGCEKEDESGLISSNTQSLNKSNTLNAKSQSSVDYTYYQSIGLFTSVVNNAISSGEALAASTGDSHGFSIVKNSNGYGISEITNLSGSGVSQGDVSLCGTCGPVVGGELDAMLNSGDPCWWLVAFTDGVWGWDNGC